MYLNVRFEIEIQEEATPEQVREWLEYQLGYRGGMSATNPLEGEEIEATKVTLG